MKPAKKKSTAVPASPKDLLREKDREIVRLRAELDERVSRRQKQVEALGRMAQSIAQGAYLQEILQLIVTMTAEMMNSKICSLMLLDDKKAELRIEVTQALSDAYRQKPPIRVGQSVSGRAVQERRPITALDVTSDTLYMYPEIAKREGLCSLLCVPMMIKSVPIGVINCYTTEPHEFQPEEIGLLQAVANQAAVAIDHTRSIQEAFEAKQALETRKLTERAKGILMKSQSMSEEAAFRFLQRQAMDRRKSMREIAEAIVLSEELRKSSSRE